MALELELLLILIATNAAPVVLRRCLKSTLAQPIDGGTLLSDGYPLFGYSKTWRGIFAGISGALSVAFMVGFSLQFTFFFALLSLLGDLFSSFIKRRLGQPPNSKCIGLDQGPETLLPLISGAFWFDYDLDVIVIVALNFLAINLLTPVLVSLLGLSSSQKQ